MKQLLILAALVCIAAPAFAVTSDVQSFSSPVYVNITPNIAVNGPSVAQTLVNGPNVPAGVGFSIPVTFRVDSNMEQLKLGAGASILYKGDVTSSTYQIAISTGGIKIVPELANPMAAHPSNVAAYVGGSVDLGGGFMGMNTEFIPFESGQNNHFSQNVVVTPSWVNGDSELPIGEYSGVVNFYAMANLPS
jgi:hypothetical protein